MDKRGSIELLNMESNNYNKNLSLDSYRTESKSSSLNSKQESVSFGLVINLLVIDWFLFIDELGKNFA